MSACALIVFSMKLLLTYCRVWFGRCFGPGQMVILQTSTSRNQNSGLISLYQCLDWQGANTVGAPDAKLVLAQCYRSFPRTHSANLGDQIPHIFAELGDFLVPT